MKPSVQLIVSVKCSSRMESYLFQCFSMTIHHFNTVVFHSTFSLPKPNDKKPFQMSLIPRKMFSFQRIALTSGKNTVIINVIHDKQRRIFYQNCTYRLASCLCCMEHCNLDNLPKNTAPETQKPPHVS